MLQRNLQVIPLPFFPYLYESEIVTHGRKIPEWFSNQSLGDSLILELPTTCMGIALFAVFQVQAHHSEFDYFQISCSPQGVRLKRFSRHFEIGDVVSDHLWVIYVTRELFETECSQIKVLFTTYYYRDEMWGDKKSYASVKKCGFRLVHEQDVEQLNQIMMNNPSSTALLLLLPIQLMHKVNNAMMTRRLVLVEVVALTKNLSAAKAMLFPKGF